MLHKDIVHQNVAVFKAFIRRLWSEQIVEGEAVLAIGESIYIVRNISSSKSAYSIQNVTFNKTRQTRVLRHLRYSEELQGSAQLPCLAIENQQDPLYEAK